MSARRPEARDYKRPRRDADGVGAGWRGFGVGLALGLLAAGGVWLRGHHAPPPTTRPAASQTVPAAASRAAKASALTGRTASTASTADDASAAAPGDGKFDFYRMLPRFEVVVPESEHGSRPAPTAQIDRPGIYFLQVGSYRDPAVAERVRAQLGRLGISATVQRVAVDTDVWHRVRVGPIRDLALLNRLRRQLEASNLDSLVIRVDD